ncbi:MAG TPA: PIG-L family deacetylase [Clostridia bacterium]|nr:PIG-L family deacetylase [Clostridia bacterium]
MAGKVAIAIGAHPDDIEFNMAGTLILLGQAGFETHYLALASGNCGSTEYNSATTRSVRQAESRQGARIIGAQFHPSLTDDLEIVYSVDLLRSVAALIREVKPGIVLTHSPQDYMEDHMATSRLAVTAAFTRGMPNFKTRPGREAAEYPVRVYHAMPHGLCDGLGRRIMPGAFVNTSGVQKLKREALAAHKSQQRWLDVSQNMNSFILAMETMALELGTMSGKFKCAEGWRRHLHLGFCEPEADPLREALGEDWLVNEAYERALQIPAV